MDSIDYPYPKINDGLANDNDNVNEYILLSCIHRRYTSHK